MPCCWMFWRYRSLVTSFDGMELRDTDVVDGRLLLCCDFLLVNSWVFMYYAGGEIQLEA